MATSYHQPAMSLATLGTLIFEDHESGLDRQTVVVGDHHPVWDGESPSIESGKVSNHILNLFILWSRIGDILNISEIYKNIKTNMAAKPVLPESQ